MNISNTHNFESIENIQNLFENQGYICDRQMATTLYLAANIEKPLFLEGEPGVGKTEVAKVMAKVLNTDLIRLQCYEGLDANAALYEWDYPRQMLEIRIQEALNTEKQQIGNDLFSEKFLLKRPLLEAIQSESETPPVLLIDEIDRSDEEFEAFLLEILSDYQISIPELGTIKAKQKPIVILTSNNTRQLHDALKRRCMFHYIDYPDIEREKQIIKTRIPDIESDLSRQICQFMQWLRTENLYKRPGISETIDWAEALLAMDCSELTEEVVTETLGCILKYKQDIDTISQQELLVIIDQVKQSTGYQQLQ